MSPVTQKIWGDGIVTSRPVYSKSFFWNDTKRPAIRVIAQGKVEVNQLATPSMKKCKQKTNFQLLYLHEYF